MITKSSAEDRPALEWIRSSHSTADGPDCVEVAALPSAVHVRDSKNVRGPELGFTPHAWAVFVAYTSTN
ncbi:DUF397 domain-containing protein [Streptomyces sp. NPDC020403]|uniref:DUF397 domain-containing protein n=1 Tax=unclassified Streptomyces TaxID=2593676 RepID=UPI0033D5BF2A